MRSSGGRLGRAAADPTYVKYHEAFAAMGRGYPAVAVYVGAGASHSWMWFADMLERIGLFDVTFVTEDDVTPGGLARYDVLLVGGGDTYAMAEAMGRAGADAVERFVRSGGLYHGSCAGGYLVLAGVDLEPFTPFQLVDGDMVNVMDSPPEPRCLEHKYLAPYGRGWVFHPVYGEVVLGPGDAGRGLDCFEGGGPHPGPPPGSGREQNRMGTIVAPLFGGPVMAAATSVADFAGSSDRAAYLWSREDAARLLNGRQAVLSASLGDGTAVASGPHLEHPLFPRANALLAELMLRHSAGRLSQASRRLSQASRRLSPASQAGAVAPGPHASGDTAELLGDIKRHVSNARIVGFGLEKIPVTWRIGVKVWEPEKVRTFLDYAWRRLPHLYAHPGGLDPEALELLAGGYEEVTRLVRSLKIRVESNLDSQPEAHSLLTRLKELTASFLSLYFKLCLEARGSHD